MMVDLYQARIALWRWSAGAVNNEITAVPCGSEPARESGVSVKQMVDVPHPSRAGSLPQGTFVYLVPPFLT